MNNLLRQLNRLRTPLFTNAFIYMSNSFIISGLGVVFWKFATQIFSQEVLGFASAYLSLVGLVSSIASLGFGFGVIRFLSEIRQKEDSAIKFLNSVFTLSAVSSVAVAICVLFLSNLFFPALDSIKSNLLGIVFFVFFCIVWTWNGLLVAIFTAFRNGAYVLWKNLIVNVPRVPLLLAFTTSEFGIQYSTSIGMLLVIIWALFFGIRKFEPGFRIKAVFRSGNTSKLLQYSFPNHVASWFWQAPNIIFPLIVFNQYGAKANSEFFLAWMIASLISVVTSSISTSMFAEGSNSKEDRISRDVKILLFSLAIQSIGVVIVLLLSEQIVGYFNQKYVSETVPLVNILSLSSYGFALHSIAQTRLRIRGRLNFIILICVLPIICILPIPIFYDLSITSFAWLWVFVLSAVGLFSFVTSLTKLQ